MLTVINDHTQEFEGVRYYRIPSGYYKGYAKGRRWRLHRMVWEAHNGPIPDGFIVHHIDGNKDNNDISNLTLMDGAEHKRFHWAGPNADGRKQCFVDGATAWMKTDKARAISAQRFREARKNDPYKTYTCLECGKEFQTKTPSGAKYCCGACRSSAYRKRKKVA